MVKLLHLRAESLDDLDVFSTLLQDSAVRVSDLAWLPKQHRFAAVVNRYRWEGERKNPERMRTGLRFEHVLGAALKNIPFSDPDHVMELLAIRARETGKKTELELIFSGHAAILLELEVIDGFLEDIGGPWNATRRPEHPV